MRSFTLFTCILLCSLAAGAQKYSWGKHFSPTAPSNAFLTEGRVISKDDAGNIYVGGTYASTADFDPGPGEFILPFLGSYTGFVAKLTPSGDLIWAKPLGGSNTIMNAMAVDRDGAVYTTGYFKGNNVDFDPGPAVYPFTAFSEDIFISKLDAEGNFVWAKTVGSSSIDEVLGIAVDENKNVYIGGNYGSTIDIDPGPGVVNLTTDGNFHDAFVLKLDQNGSYINARRITTPASDYCWGLELKNNFIHMITWSGNRSAVHKLTTDLQPVWTRTTEGLSAWPRSIAVDNAGNIIVSGMFQGNVDFDPGPGQQSIYAPDNLEMFIYKLDANGYFKWVRYTPGTNTGTTWVKANGLDTDEQGNIFVIGQFNRSYTFEPGNNSSQLSPQNSDVFIEKLNYAGQYLSVVKMGGANNDVGRAIHVDENGNIFSTGYFINTADLNPDPVGSNTVTTYTGESGVFISKLARGNNISGNVFIDINNDGIQQAGEVAYTGAVTRAVKNSTASFGLSRTDGSYDIYADTGTYTITLPQVPLYHISTVTSHTATFTGYGLDDSLNNFPVYPIPGVNDLQLYATANARARRNEIMSIVLTYKNVGTTILSGNVSLQHAAELIYQQASLVPDSHVGALLTWNFSNMQPNETRSIDVQLLVPVTAGNGTIFSNTAVISPVLNDTTPLNNQYIVNTELIGSFDPNDKSVLPAGPVSPAFVSADSTSLQYVIRFQNTGNDTAFLVVLADTLEAKLDIKTLQIIGASHPFTTSIRDGNVLEFRFNNILLPDSTSNEPLSHGFAAFSIKSLTTLTAGDSVSNKAAIYFDYNSAVITNKVVTHIVTALPVTLSAFALKILPGCAGVSVSFSSSAEINNASYSIEKTKDGINWEAVTTIPGANNSGGSKSYIYTHHELVTGTVFYRLRQTATDGAVTYSSTKRISCAAGNGKLYPNPVTNFLTMEMGEAFQYTLLDAKGRVLLTGNSSAPVKKINVAQLSKGSYFLQVKTTAGIASYNIVKQ